jgi:hypothetical protein
MSHLKNRINGRLFDLLDKPLPTTLHNRLFVFDRAKYLSILTIEAFDEWSHHHFYLEVFQR